LPFFHEKGAERKVLAYQNVGAKLAYSVLDMLHLNQDSERLAPLGRPKTTAILWSPWNPFEARITELCIKAQIGYKGYAVAPVTKFLGNSDARIDKTRTSE
jgi:hypothetical protein